MAAKRRLPVRKKAETLELRVPDLRKNLLAVLEKVETDERVRAAFVKNPAKLITAKVAHVALSAHQISETNRLLFSLIANDKMRAWLSRYKGTGTGKAAKQEFAAAFAKQVASLRDENILTALLGNALAGNGVPGLSQVAYQCVCNETTGKTSTTCTPVAKNQVAFGSEVVDPETVRALSEALVARAKTLVKQGALVNLEESIG